MRALGRRQNILSSSVGDRIVLQVGVGNLGDFIPGFFVRFELAFGADERAFWDLAGFLALARCQVIEQHLGIAGKTHHGK